MSYTFQTFHGGGKPHYIPNSLLEGIRRDMISRGCPLWDKHTREVDEMYIDFGGMMMIGVPMVKGKLSCGIELEVPADQVPHCLVKMAKALRQSPRMTDDGQPYYKVHGRWQCYVFTPEMLKEAHTLFSALEGEADKALDAFYAERRAKGLPVGDEIVKRLAEKGCHIEQPKAEA